VDLTLGPEQEAIRDAVRGMLATRLPMKRVRALLDDPAGIDVDAWREAGSLGWFALGLPETAGGAGYGPAEEMILFVELARALAPGPWLGTLLAAHALVGRAEHAGVAGGERRIALLDDPADTAGETLDAVADGASADGVVLLGSRSVRLVPVRVEASVTGIDPTRRRARLRQDGSALALDADPTALRTLATLLVAAEAVGVAERTLELSVEYAKVRQQFGKPIGSFQAVKHRCADMAVRTEVARSITTFAAVALAEDEPEAARYVGDAKALATDAALANASDNVQNHGGMGYTWEADAHLFLKRAWALEHVLGTRAQHLDALIAPARA
jgi:alkylation response protein AidB-like acyl-CoA dehydrogenase